MKWHILSKKTLAIFLTLTMLMSCMVWSGVSAETTYTCNFTGYAVTANTDIDVTGGSIATVVDTGEADYGSAMKLHYQDGATGPWAGFRFFADTNTKVQYDSGQAVAYFYVEFDYKVLSVASNVDLYAACGSMPWNKDEFNALGSAEVIESLTGATEWKTARTAVHSNTDQNSAVHIYLVAADAATAAGTAVLVDNVTVVKDYVPTSVVLDLGYDSLTKVQYGLADSVEALPADPARNGYDFLGWFDAAEGGNRVTELSFSESGSTKTIYAQWEEASSLSTLTFNVNGGTAIAPINGAPGAVAVVDKPTKSGHIFEGWCSDVDLQNKVTALTFPAEVGATTTLHAKWTAVNYRVMYAHFDSKPTKIYGSGSGTGYGDAGWPTNGAASSSSGDNTKNAMYILGTEGGGYNNSNGYLKFTPDGLTKDGNPGNTTPVGFRLYGNEWQQSIWDGVTNQTVVGGTDLSRAVSGLPYRITFKYKVNALDVPATFMVHTIDGSLSGETSYSNLGASLAHRVIQPVAEAGEWTTMSMDFTAGGSVAWRLGLAVNQDPTAPVEVLVDELTIEWLSNTRRTNVIFNYNDGITADGVETPVAGDVYTLPIPATTRPGYKFIGWVDAEGNPVPETLTVPYAPVTYTAVWEEDTSSTTIAFEENGGNEIADIYGTAGTAPELPTTTRGLYGFEGWYLDEALEIPAEGVTFPEEGTLTLYAKWSDPTPADNGARPSGVIGTMDFETGEVSDYIHQTGWAGVMEMSTDVNHTSGGSRSFMHVMKSGHNAQRGRPRIVLQAGDATKATPLVVKAGESYTISFWLRTPMANSSLTFYAATMGASDVDTMINTTDKPSTGDVHTLQTLSYFAVGTSTNGAFNAKEPSYQTLQADQWTRIIMTVPSIVLDDPEDENYLAIGYTLSDTSSSDFVERPVYIDDITVCSDIELNGTLLGTQTFESGTADNFTRFTNKYNLSVSTDTAHAGSTSSLKAEIRGVSNSQRVRPRLVLKLGDATTAGNFVVEEGKSYTVSFWARVNGANHGTFTFYLATMGASDVSTQINTESGTVHTLQTLSYCSNGSPFAGGDPSSWGAAQEVNSAWLSADMWQQIVMTIPAATLDAAGEDNYLALGYTLGKATSADFSADLYIDDIAIYDSTFVDGAELLDDVTSAYQYVGGSAQDNGLAGGLGAAENYAVYDKGNGEIRTAFRVGGTYTPAGEDLTKVKLNGQTYEIVERGVLLGYGDVTTPTLDNNKGIVTAENLNRYWTKNAGTGKVTFTALVKGISVEMVNTSFVARSYMKILVGGEEVLIYSKVSAAFTPQGIYDKACQLSGETYGWFA